MKKIAAPGRRGSTKRTAFIGDGEIVDEIDPNSLEAKREQEELEAKRLAEQEEAEAEAAAELLRQQQEAEAIAERKRQIHEEKLRLQREREAEEAEQLRLQQEKEAEEAAVAAAAVEKKRLKQEKLCQQELERKQQEEAEAAAELLRQQQEAEAIAERKKKIREEKLRLQREREAEEAEQLRLQQEREAEEAAAAAELLRQQQEEAEAEALAERKRLRREEKLRLQREAEEAERIRQEQEAAAELLRQQQEEEELAERKRLRKEEKLRKRREEEEELRRQQEEAEAELLRQQQEGEAERQKQLEIEENERIKNELARQEEIRRYEEENARIEQERINREKQNAAKAKSKRDAFLDDMDSFSEAFSQKQAIKEDKLQKTLASEETLLASTISSASSGYTAPQSTRSQQQEPVTKSPVKQSVTTTTTSSSTSEEVPVPSYYDKNQVVTQEKEQKPSTQNPNSEQFNLLASALFSTPSNVDDIENDPYATTSSSKSNQQKQEEEEVLRLPNRSVTVNKSKKEKGSVTFNETPSSAPPRSEVMAATTVSSRNEAKKTNYEEPDEEEDEETFLPRMTEAEKAVWRAKQEDLTRRRKDFHGACTYAFKGVFAWQMYSAVDAVDEFGKAYTEYLMRCQWGTTWENMQPWLVARRFREFDALNDLLQKNFPQLKDKMFPLPKKLIFGSLTSETIDKRTKDIEEYISTIITDIPQMLRSRYIDEFFGISDRIKTITNQIEELSKKLPKSVPEDEPLYTGMVSFAPGVEEEMDGGNNNSKTNGDSKLEAHQEEEEKGVIKPLQLEDLFTLDDIENLCNDNTRPFDSDELGQIEEYVRDLRSILRKTKAKSIPVDPHVRKYINLCQNNWVRLHRTCLIDPSGSTGGVMLIPRAMQAEEELDHAIKELRSLLIAQSIGSPLHF